MLRISLIAYLMVGAVAGPAWCCCTLDRLAAWCVPVSKAKSEPSSQPTCCHRQAPLQTRNDSSKPQKQSPSPKESPCPCKEHQSGQANAAILTGQESNDARWSGAESDLSAFLGVALLWADAESGTPISSSAVPSVDCGLSGRDILCAFQIFRC